jgi:hypothetical protein
MEKKKEKGLLFSKTLDKKKKKDLLNRQKIPPLSLKALPRQIPPVVEAKAGRGAPVFRHVFFRCLSILETDENFRESGTKKKKRY